MSKVTATKKKLKPGRRTVDGWNLKKHSAAHHD